MDNKLFDKVKYVSERFLFHGGKFLKDTGEVFKNRINTAEEASKLLRTSASVKDIVELENSIKEFYFGNGKINSYMPSDEYTLNDDYGFKLYYFNGKKNDSINDEELLKVSNVINSIENKPKIVFAIRIYNKYQYYFKIHEGKNGSGDFVDDDMRNVISYLDAMKKSGAAWRTVTDLQNDIADDISDWVITFTVD